MKPDRRKGLIAKIHVAKTQLGLDDETYRALLKRTGGRASCADMDVLALQSVMAEMVRLGFVPSRKHLGAKPLHSSGNRAMMGKLSALLASSGKSWAYADGMARRMFGKDKVSLLTGDELHRLIAALNIHIRKAQAAAAAAMGA